MHEKLINSMSYRKESDSFTSIVTLLIPSLSLRYIDWRQEVWFLPWPWQALQVPHWQWWCHQGLGWRSGSGGFALSLMQDVLGCVCLCMHHSKICHGVTWSKEWLYYYIVVGGCACLLFSTCLCMCSHYDFPINMTKKVSTTEVICHSGIIHTVII